jgi:hypothetical protein
MAYAIEVWTRLTYSVGSARGCLPRSGSGSEMGIAIPPEVGGWDGRSEEGKNGEDIRVREVHVKLRNVFADCKESKEDYRPRAHEDMGDTLRSFIPMRRPMGKVAVG